MRPHLPALALAVALGLGLTTPARAADLDKYLPEGAGVYVHVNVKQLLTAPVVRKAIPMAVTKYGDQILPLFQLAKALDPNAAKIKDEDVKQGIDELKKPETIANAFDAAKDIVTDVIVAGDPNDEEKVLILVKCPPQVNAETVDAIVTLAGQAAPVKVQKHKQGRGTVYEVQLPPPQNQTLFAAVPEAGVLCFGTQKEMVAKALAGNAGGLSEKLKPLAAKRAEKDFLFVAVAEAKDEGVKAGYGSLVLDKDISGSLTITYDDAKKAQAAADEMNESLSSFADTLKNFLGDQAKEVKPVLDKMKAQATGATVTGQFTVPGAVIEKLLTKEKGD